MKRVVITGSRGLIGSILTNALTEYEVIGLDLPEVDAKNFNQLKEKTVGADVLIHLAYSGHEIDETDTLDDLLMTNNVYKVAFENQIKRVIMASSVHADQYDDWKEGDELKTADTMPSPNNPYGVYKVHMETLGRFYAKKGIEVICIRFGGVNREDSPDLDEPHYKSIYLSHEDLINLTKQAIEVEKISNNYELLYAVSDNTPRIHSTKNSIGWEPEKKKS